jgi:cytochrome P450
MALPPTLPRRVTLPRLFWLARNPVRGFSYYQRRFGDTFTMRVGGARKTIVTSDPGWIQHVLQKNHRNYEKSAIQTDQLAQFIGRGLLTNTGEDWLRQRRLIQPGFHRDRLASVTQLMWDELQAITGELATDIRRRPEIDMYPRMLATTFRIIARTLFSDNLSDERLALLSENITRLQQYIVYAIRLPFLRPLLRASGLTGRMIERREASFRVLEEIIAERRAGTTREDLLQMLLDTRYEDTGEPMDPRRLLEEVAILFVAGHETSANALAWALYTLARHPEVQDRLRTELDAVLGDRTPDMQNVRELPYLTQVINETMRCYPPAWITDRVALADDHYAGFDIPQGIVVAPFIYGVHHHPAYWSDPERFDPERFAPGRPLPHPYAFMPFGGGPRLCIGNNFAMLEMQLALIALLRRFHFRPVAGREAHPFPLVTLRPKPGAWVTVDEL